MTDKSNKQQGGLDYQPHFQLSFLAPKYWTTWVGVFLLWLLTFTPSKFRNGLARLLGLLTRQLGKKRYRIAKTNLSLCFPDKTEQQLEQLIRQFFYYQVRVMLDYAFLWFASKKRLRRLYHFKHAGELEGLRTLNHSVVLLTCHSLALDHGAQALSLQHPIVGLFKPLRNQVLNWLVARGRTRFNTRIYERVYGMMGVISGVKQGALHFYIPDEDLGDSRSVFLPFFGVQKATIAALGRLAKICNAKVLPCMTYLNDQSGQYEIHFLPSLEQYPSGDKQADALRMNQALEQLILLAPEQYIWTFRYFQTRPEGEASFYE